MKLFVTCWILAFASVLSAGVERLREDLEVVEIIDRDGREERVDREPMDGTFPRQELHVVEVAAPDINCISDLDCRITADDSTDRITLPAASGSAFLQSRLSVAEPRTEAEGLRMYEYRVFLGGLSGGPSTPCIKKLVLDFGFMAALDYDGDGRSEHAYVVTHGVSPGVAPSAISSDGRQLWVTFDPPLCAGESSLFFGLASPRPVRFTEALLTDSRGDLQSVAARTPDMRRSFVRGDGDSSGVIELSDGLATLNYLFAAGEVPACLDAADLNASGTLELTDAIALFDWLFLGGDRPPAPSPNAPEYDVTSCAYASGTELGCERPSRLCFFRDIAEFIRDTDDLRVAEELEPVERTEIAEEGEPADEPPSEARPVEAVPPVGEVRPIDRLSPQKRLPAVEVAQPIDRLQPVIRIGG